MWSTNCQCLAEYDEVIAAKDLVIEELKQQLSSHTVSDVQVAGSHNSRVMDSHETSVREEIHTREASVHLYLHQGVPTLGELDHGDGQLVAGGAPPQSTRSTHRFAQEKEASR